MHININKKTKKIKIVYVIVLILFLSIFSFYIGQFLIGLFKFESQPLSDFFSIFIKDARRIGRDATKSNIVFFIFIYAFVYFIISLLRINKKRIFITYVFVNFVLYLIGISEIYCMTYRGLSWTLNDINILSTGLIAAQGIKFYISLHMVLSLIIMIIVGVILFYIDTFEYDNKMVFIFIFLLLFSYLSVGEYNKIYGDIFADNIYTRGIVENLLLGVKNRYKIPESYSLDKVKILYNKYKNILKENHEKKDNSNVNNNVKNVIVIVEESFTPQLSRYTNIDIMPNYNNLKNAIKGNVHIAVQATAASEFSYLTGLNVIYGGADFADYYEKLYDSFVLKMKNQGYNTTSIHFCDDIVYKYKYAYKNLLFDNRMFFNDGTYKHQVDWIPANDVDTFDNLLNLMYKNDGKNFYYVVTTSAHDLYFGDYYNDWKINYTNDNFTDGVNQNINRGIALVRKNDSDIGYLIDKLKEMDDECVVLMFGDHCFREDIGIDFINKEKPYTPFFIWSNKGNVKDVYKDVYFLPYLNLDVCDILGIPDTPFYAFLRDMRKHILAINGNSFYSVRLNKFIDKNEADNTEKEFLNNYDMIYASYYDDNARDLFFVKK